MREKRGDRRSWRSVGGMEDGEGGNKYLGCFVNWIFPSTPSPSTSKSAATKSALNRHSAISIFSPKAKLSRIGTFCLRFLFLRAAIQNVFNVFLILRTALAIHEVSLRGGGNRALNTHPSPAKHTAKKAITLHSHVSRSWQALWVDKYWKCAVRRRGKTVFGCVAFPGRFSFDRGAS